MKDLIQEGRKIQQAFKNNIVLTEGTWESNVRGDYYTYNRSFLERLSGLFDRIRKSGTLGNVPPLKNIYAYYNPYGYKDTSGKDIIVMYIQLKTDFFRDKIENLEIKTVRPFTEFQVTAFMYDAKRAKKIYSNTHINDLAKKLLSELIPVIEKKQSEEDPSQKYHKL